MVLIILVDCHGRYWKVPDILVVSVRVVVMIVVMPVLVVIMVMVVMAMVIMVMAKRRSPVRIRIIL